MTSWIKPGTLARVVWTRKFGLENQNVVLGYGELPVSTGEEDLIVPSGIVVLLTSEIHEGSDFARGGGTVTLLYDNRVWWTNCEELEEVKDE